MSHALLSRRSEVARFTQAAEEVDVHRLHVVRERYAGEAYWSVEPLEEDLRRSTIVVTDNPCPESALDLLELNVSAVFIGQPSAETWLEACLYAQSGLRCGLGLEFQTTLKRSEREPLKFLPMAWSNARIAAYLGRSERTIRNRISDALDVMQFRNRTQLAMYYIGQWQWLEADREPLSVNRSSKKKKS
jgi:DNA-binding NarL/FixJ family response regulator